MVGISDPRRFIKPGKRGCRLVAVLVGLAGLLFLDVAATAAPAFVQRNFAVPQTSQTSVSATFTSAQTAGNLNVVAIAWFNTTAHVLSVTDTTGNAYVLAVGPTSQAAAGTQSIYYAKSIGPSAANTNRVTVTFDAAVPYPDLRVAEYSGIDPINAFDVASAGTGTGTTSSSATVTTTNANDLLVGANYVTTATLAAGSGFTNRVITNPDGSILEDRIVTATGSYSATATLSSGSWVMQMAAFRATATGGGDTQAPTAPGTPTLTVASSTQINLGWAASTDNVGITNYLIERCQGTGCTTFAQVGTSASTSFGNTGLTASTSYSYRVRATDAAGNMSVYSGTSSATTSSGADTTPPSVSITAPSAGSTQTATITLSATASDVGTGVGGLQFQIDGVNVGAPITTAPYSTSFDTSQFGNGAHTVSAIAWDNASNVGVAPAVSVTFSNAVAGNPAQTGLWLGVRPWPLIAVHVNLMLDGNVLVSDGQSLGTDARVWNPLTGGFNAVPVSDNIFCGGHSQLSDGRIIVVGGHVAAHVGLTATNLFNPVTRTWSSAAPMANARWYPSATKLADGRILTVSGETNCDTCYAQVSEVYNPANNAWSPLVGAPLSIPYYPHQFVLPDGRLFLASTNRAPYASRVLDLGTQTWSIVDPTVLDAGSAAMYLPGKILKSGSSREPDVAISATQNSAYVIDMTAPGATWRATGSMAYPRTFHTLTILPDGTVLAAGGGVTTNAVGLSDAVLPAEVWSPATEAWTTMASMHAPRLYHSAMLLLPDATVLMAGGGHFNGVNEPTDQLSAEVFAPPYLFKGPRPTISSSPAQISYGQAFTVQTPDAARIAKTVLIALGSVTHGIDMNQRYVPLTFTAGASSLAVTAPLNGNLAPPGYYMLFLVDANGVPSVASIVSVAASGSVDVQPPNAPTTLTATATSSTQINLAWSGATDNIGVTNYLIERCQGASCTTYTQIAASTTGSYSDIGLTPSTSYSYRVRAIDAAANVSPYSTVATQSTLSVQDTQAPTAPGTPVLTVASSTQINLSWSASTDNVGVTTYLIERCQGAGCTTFAQIGTSTATSYASAGLSPSATYVYRVRATDAAGNLSGYSGTASATTSVVAAATPQFVQRNSAVPQTAQTQVSAAFAAAQTAGNLNVIAVGWYTSTAHVLSVTDTAGNTYALAVGPTTRTQAGAQSIYYAKSIGPAAANANLVTVTFDAAVQYPDLRIAEYSGIDPINPLDVTAASNGTGATSSSGAVTTTNANDLLVGANYVSTATTAAGSGFTNRVITNPDGSILEDRVVTAIGSYSATAAISSGDWVMQMAAFRAASGGGGDTQAPTAPGSPTLTVASSTQINVSWAASTDNVGVTNYLIERCQGAGCTTFAQVGTSTTTTFSNTGLTASTSYSYRVCATDAAGNLGAYSTAASATTSTATDTQAPTVPGTPVASVVSSTQINLSWASSTDNVGVTSYLIERCQGAGCTGFAQIGTSTSTTFNNSGLTASTSYSYRIRATDAAGNLSIYSGTVTAVTSASNDTQAPGAPGTPTATAVSNTQINLSWTPATDNVGVTNYLIERCQGANCTTFIQVGTSATTSYSSTGLAASTSYTFRVRASDAAGNLGGYSGTATAITLQSQNLGVLSYIQGANTTPQTPQTVVNLAFTGAQTAGNLNVIVIAWSDSTSSVVSVTDTKGNVYNLAAGPTTISGVGTQSIYYSTPIAGAAAGANSVRVTFSAAAPYPDLRIAEYAGVDPSNPIDAGAEATGSNALSSSGSTVTFNPYDLLVAANKVETFTTGAGSGFTSRMITNPNGDILEDRVVTTAGTYAATAPVSPAGPWIMNFVAFRGGQPPGADSTPPTVSLTAPSAGAALGGTVTLTASASDVGTGVAGVQFQVDGVNVGPAVTGTSYTYALNTARFANGTHTITVYAWDGNRNVTYSNSVTVTFNNASAGNPAVTGLWSGAFPWPLVAIHLNMLSDGRVLAWDMLTTGTPDPRVWDPLTSTMLTVPTNDGANLFCAGQTLLPDGRLLAAGGEVYVGVGISNSHQGLNQGHIFDPATNQWSSTPNMAYGRWYPNLTTLPDGRVLTMAGETNCFECDAAVPEIYNPTSNAWTQLNTASFVTPWYPYTFVLPDGRILVAGSAESPMATSVLNLSTNSWSTVDARVLDGGSAAMTSPGKVLKAGTSNSTESAVVASSSNAYVLDMTAGSPAWRQVASMAYPRTYHVMTTLPDGTVLVTGGGRTTGFADMANAVYQAELWNPTSETWTTLSSMSAPRLYHQTAILLPDARVLVSGSGRGYGRADATDQLSAEVYAPPYLFKGPRPVITSAPTQATAGQAFTVQTPDAARVARVTLVRFGTMTHTFNMDQRFLDLSFTVGSGSLTVTPPANSNLVPPGYYMLFLIDNLGVPSVSKTVRF